jgi:hypothetical protein
MMTPGQAYSAAKLVRVIASGPHSFCAGILIDETTGRVICAAPILGWTMNQHQDKLRQSFKRLGWKATVVRRAKQ